MRKILFVFLLTIPFISFAQSKRAFKKEIKKHRKHYKQEFAEDARSPFYKKEKEMKHMKFYKPNRQYRLKGTFTLTPNAKPFDMATYSGITKPYIKYGIATVMLEGKPLQVNVYQSLRLKEMDEYKDYLFIPFKDHTNGESTYGGGRYIDISMGDIKNGMVEIDFNKCYNPWCAFSDGYNCPVPPIENHFDLEILAGEKNFAKAH